MRLQIPKTGSACFAAETNLEGSKNKSLISVSKQSLCSYPKLMETGNVMARRPLSLRVLR